MPILLHATPIEVPGVNQFEYIVHLTTAMQVNTIALVQAYNRRTHTRILSQNEILDLPAFIYPTTQGGGQGELRRPAGAVNVRGIQPDVIEDIMEMVQSDELRSVMDLKWTTVINISAIRDALGAGRGGDGPPKFLVKHSFTQTWNTQMYNDHEVNCAAFALCNFMSVRDEYPTRVNFDRVGHVARKRAHELQQELGWGDVVTLDQIEDFIKAYSRYKVLVFIPNKRSPEASFLKTFTGALYEDPRKTCILINFNYHWALSGSIQSFVNQMKPGGNFTYCRECEKIKANPTRLGLAELPCHYRGPPKKKRKQKKACMSPQCEGHSHGDEKCPFTVCPACNLANNDPSHRCCLLPRSFGQPHPHDKFWSDELNDYAFCTEQDGDGSVPAFFAYDIETSVYKTTISPLNPRNLTKPPPDANFGYDLEGFSEIAKMYISEITDDDEDIVNSIGLSSEYNRLVPNLIVCTNIYSSKIPETSGAPMYEPELVRFYGPDCVKEFIEFATSYNKGNNYFVAHNGSGFDSKFIFQTGLDLNLNINQIMRGSNFIKLSLKGDTYNGPKTTFIDNMLHLPGSLSGLAKDFFGSSPDEGLRTNLSKGYFPHGFNLEENQDYVGPIPDLKYFTPETLKLGSGETKFDSVLKLQEWHRNYVGDWDFKKEIVKYCDLDVVILAALLKEYMSISIPKGAIPLTFTTAPAYVHELIMLRATEHLTFHETDINKLKAIFSTDESMTKAQVRKAAFELRAENTRKHLEEMSREANNGWAVLKPPEYSMIRLSLRGGRTEVRSSLMTLSPEEDAAGKRIVYQDVTSLYPAMQLTKQFCVGSPIIHFYDYAFRPCYKCRNNGNEYRVKCDCVNKGYTGGSLDIVDATDRPPTSSEILADDDFFGYVCVDLTPPKDLYHPVIQIKKTEYNEHGKVKSIKCQNNLVDKDHEELYLDTPTFKKALESGYILNRIFRFDKYKKGKGSWVPAGIEFYVDKERTSGPAPSTTTRGIWCREYEKEFPGKPTPACDRDAYIALNEYLVPGLGAKLLESMTKYEWSKQPAKRKVFKIFNNCGWGKHAQRPIMPTTKTFDTETNHEDIHTLFQNITNGTSVLGGVLVYNKGTTLMFTVTDAKRDPQLHNSYLAAAAMVPAYGRLCLLEGLELVGERAAMCDTDSIVYKTGDKNIPFSSLLGRFKEEDISEDGIVEFVGYGPKCYSIKTKKIVDVRYPDGSLKREPKTLTKLKGISQTVETRGIDHDFMFKSMLTYLETGQVGSVKVPQWGIKTKMCLDGAPCIYTQNYAKDFKLMDDGSIKGFRINNGVKIYPFGFTK